MSSLGRAAVLCGGVMLAVTLSACSGGSSSGGQSNTPSPNAPAASGISDPRDAATANLCSLLPPTTANAAGVAPQGAAEISSTTHQPACTWEEAGDGPRQVSITITPADISVLNRQAGTYQDFRKLQIAGHPAAIANHSAPGTADICETFVGTKNGQMLLAQGAVHPDSVGKEDPCQLAQQALQAAVPNLPSAK